MIEAFPVQLTEKLNRVELDVLLKDANVSNEIKTA